MKYKNINWLLAAALCFGLASCSQDNIVDDDTEIQDSSVKVTRATIDTNDAWIALGFKKSGNGWTSVGNYNKTNATDTAKYKVTFDDSIVSYRFIAATPQEANIQQDVVNDTTTFVVNLAHGSDVAICYKDTSFRKPENKLELIDKTLQMPAMRHQSALLGFNISLQSKKNTNGLETNPYYGWYIQVDTFELHNVAKQGVMRFIEDGENKGNQADQLTEAPANFITNEFCAFTNKSNSTTQYVQVAMVPYKYSEEHSVSIDLIMRLINPADATDYQRVSYTIGLFSYDSNKNQGPLDIYSGRAYTYNLKIAASQPELWLYVDDWDGTEQSHSTTVGGGNNTEGTNDDGTPKTPDNVSDWILDWESTWGSGTNNNDYNSLGN